MPTPPEEPPRRRLVVRIRRPATQEEGVGVFPDLNIPAQATSNAGFGPQAGPAAISSFTAATMSPGLTDLRRPHSPASWPGQRRPAAALCRLPQHRRTRRRPQPHHPSTAAGWGPPTATRASGAAPGAQPRWGSPPSTIDGRPTGAAGPNQEGTGGREGGRPHRAPTDPPVGVAAGRPAGRRRSWQRRRASWAPAPASGLDGAAAG
jgi:hypothetical protein